MPGEKGFSLVEVMVTFSIIVLMIISIFSVFPQSRKGIDHAEQRLNAATIAERMLENEMSKDWINIANGNGTVTYSGLNNGAPCTQQYQYEIKRVILDTVKKQLWVTVTWQDRTGTNKLTVETLVINNYE